MRTRKDILADRDDAALRAAGTSKTSIAAISQMTYAALSFEILLDIRDELHSLHSQLESTQNNNGDKL